MEVTLNIALRKKTFEIWLSNQISNFIKFHSQSTLLKRQTIVNLFLLHSGFVCKTLKIDVQITGGAYHVLKFGAHDPRNFFPTEPRVNNHHTYSNTKKNKIMVLFLIHVDMFGAEWRRCHVVTSHGCCSGSNRYYTNDLGVPPPLSDLTTL